MTNTLIATNTTLYDVEYGDFGVIFPKFFHST